MHPMTKRQCQCADFHPAESLEGRKGSQGREERRSNDFPKLPLQFRSNYDPVSSDPRWIIMASAHYETARPFSIFTYKKRRI